MEKDHMEIVEESKSAVTEIILNAGPSEVLDASACKAGGKHYPENDQSSRRPDHIKWRIPIIV